MTVREFHQVRFSGDVTRAGNSGNEVLGRLHAVASLGEFAAQMLRTLSSGMLRAVANEANAGRLDVGNQLVDFRLRLRIQRQRDCGGEEQGDDGSERLAHEIAVLFHIDLGFGEIKITPEDPLGICRFIVVHLCLASHSKGYGTK